MASRTSRTNVSSGPPMVQVLVNAARTKLPVDHGKASILVVENPYRAPLRVLKQLLYCNIISVYIKHANKSVTNEN